MSKFLYMYMVSATVSVWAYCKLYDGCYRKLPSIHGSHAAVVSGEVVNSLAERFVRS